MSQQRCRHTHKQKLIRKEINLENTSIKRSAVNHMKKLKHHHLCHSNRSCDFEISAGLIHSPPETSNCTYCQNNAHTTKALYKPDAQYPLFYGSRLASGNPRL